MVNDVINAITDAMSAKFTALDGYTIYTGDVPQDFDPKTFIVNSTAPNRVKKNYSAYEFDDLIAIQYNPQGGQDEINDIIDRLQECLEVITITRGNNTTKTRTEQTNVTVLDGVLTMIVRVADVYLRYPGGDPMTDVEIGVTNG